MALSARGDDPAAAGLLSPTAGAILQEGIDIAAIAIALTALLPGRTHTVALPAADLATAQRLYAQHSAIRSVVQQSAPWPTTWRSPNPTWHRCDACWTGSKTELLPHERAEEAQLLPILARALAARTRPAPSAAPTPRSNTRSAACARPARPGQHPEPEEIIDLRAGLYGLYAILQLHNAQEEENAFSLMPTAAS